MTDHVRMSLFTLILVTAASPVLSSGDAAEYFLSPAGNDSNPGTRARPWKSLDKANSSLKAGDVATFLPGDYAGVLCPQHHGQPDRPMTYRSEHPRGARLVGGNPVIQLDGRHDLVLDGFSVEPLNGVYLSANKCEGLVIRNCHFEGSRGSYVAARFVECRNVFLRDNIFTRHLAMGNGAVLQGNMIQTNHCDRFVLEGNTIGKAGHSPAHLRECTNLVVRRNLFCAKWGRGFETFNAKPMLFEENVITEEVDSGGSADSRGKVLCMDGIFRRNLVIRNYDAALASNSYIYRNGMPAWVLKNSRLYHNTLYHNHSYTWIITSHLDDLTNVSDNIWKNNIFHDNDPLGDFLALRIGRVGEGNRFVRNAFFGDRAGRRLIERWNKDQGNRRFTLTQAEQELGSLFERNLEVDPQFLDTDTDDYRLTPGSPCVDAGEYLTVTTRASEGRVLPVEDTRWFYDGFGIDGEQGDLIFVGPQRHEARVVGVDREQNVLTLDRDVSCRAGEPVTLPYAGRAPDLGAMESGAVGQPWFYRITVPNDIRWRPPSGAKTPLVTSDFEDATLEQWGYVWNLDRKRNTSYARVKGNAAKGTHSLRLFATADKSILAADVKPRVWDIDRFPMVRFAYRMAPGVPVGLWLDGFDTQEHGTGRVCVGGSPASNAGRYKNFKQCVLIDDDRWHTATIDARTVRKTLPHVKHLQAFSFYTNRNGHKGQEFWIDEFSIGPE